MSFCGLDFFRNVQKKPALGLPSPEHTLFYILTFHWLYIFTGKDPDGTERIQYKAGGPIPRCQKHFNSLWEKPVTPTPTSSGNLSPIDKLVVENQQLTKYFWEFYHKVCLLPQYEPRKFQIVFASIDRLS